MSKFAEKNVNIDGNQGFKFWGEKKLTNSSKVKGFSKSLPEKNYDSPLSTVCCQNRPGEFSQPPPCKCKYYCPAPCPVLWCFLHFPSYQNLMQYNVSRTKSQSSLLAARLNHKTHEINPQQSKFGKCTANTERLDPRPQGGKASGPLHLTANTRPFWQAQSLRRPGLLTKKTQVGSEHVYLLGRGFLSQLRRVKQSQQPRPVFARRPLKGRSHYKSSSSTCCVALMHSSWTL